MRVALATVSLCWIAVMLLVLDALLAGSAPATGLLAVLFILSLGSAALSYAHARYLGRSSGGWGVAGLLFSFATPWVLALSQPSPNLAKNLEKMKADGDAEGLVEAMFDRHENLALDAYIALYKMDPKRTVPPLLRALSRKGKAPDVKQRVIDLLARSSDEEAIHALLAALGDRGFRNRADVALALKNVNDPRVCRALLPLLRESDEHLRYSVMSTLGDLRCADAALPLMEILKKGGQWDRSTAAAALGKMGSPDATGPLLEALGDRRLEVRSSAIEALGHLADKRAVEPLLAMLEEESRQTGGKDPRWFLRHSLLKALGELNDPRACGPLLARLSDPNPQVRDAAAEAYSNLRRTAQQQGMEVPAVEVIKCVGCGRWLRRSPLDGLEVLLKSVPDISGTQVYPCKACGAVFCIDCMAKAVVLDGSRQCPSCFKPSGW